MQNKIARLGIVGTGRISLQAAEAARKSGFALTAVLSRTRENGEAFARSAGVERVITDPCSFFGDSELDAIYIASPNALHCEQTVAALREGKHVLCEKPLASSYAEYRRMRDEADSRGLVFLEAMRPLHDPAFALIRKALPLLGKLRRADLVYCQYSSRYDAFRRGERTNTFDPSLSNAALMDIGVYPIAVMVALFGDPLRFASSSDFLENGFESNGSAIFDYPGMQATVAYSKIVDAERESEIIGEKGSLFIDRVSRVGRLTLCPRGGQREAIEYRPLENNMVYEFSDFAAMIRGELSPDFYTAASDSTMRLLDAIRERNRIVFK